MTSKGAIFLYLLILPSPRIHYGMILTDWRAHSSFLYVIILVWFLLLPESSAVMHTNTPQACSQAATSLENPSGSPLQKRGMPGMHLHVESLFSSVKRWATSVHVMETGCTRNPHGRGFNEVCRREEQRVDQTVDENDQMSMFLCGCLQSESGRGRNNKYKDGVLLQKYSTT